MQTVASTINSFSLSKEVTVGRYQIPAPLNAYIRLQKEAFFRIAKISEIVMGILRKKTLYTGQAQYYYQYLYQSLSELPYGKPRTIITIILRRKLPHEQISALSLEASAVHSTLIILTLQPNYQRANSIRHWLIRLRLVSTLLITTTTKQSDSNSSRKNCSVLVILILSSQLSLLFYDTSGLLLCRSRSDKLLLSEKHRLNAHFDIENIAALSECIICSIIIAHQLPSIRPRKITQHVYTMLPKTTSIPLPRQTQGINLEEGNMSVVMAITLTASLTAISGRNQ